MSPRDANAPTAPHVKIGDYFFMIDEDAEVPFRRISDSLMQPRTDVSGVPGAINLQRDVWLWSMSDFAGGEGREVFDSSDPLGPPTFWKTDGGVDVRVRGEFSLHPDETFYPNKTGGSVPTETEWTNTEFTTVTGSPTYSAGVDSQRVILNPGDVIKSPNVTPGNIPVRFIARFVNAKTTASNKLVSVQMRVRNETDGTTVTDVTKTVKENEPVVLQHAFTATAAKEYSIRLSNEEAVGTNTVRVHYAIYQAHAATLTPNDVRALQLGVGDNVWALNWDGTNTDVLRWNFSTDTWDQLVANLEASQPRGFTGSDSLMYVLTASGNIWKVNSAGTATDYANPPSTSGVGEELALTIANNKLYALYSQALFELTLDSTAAGLPFDEGEADYSLVMSPGEFPAEASPDTTKRQHLSAIPNGVRFFQNMRGSQTVIYEFSDGAGVPKWHLPKGYIATAIHHYANITFIAATFTNSAGDPAAKRAGLFYIGSDTLLRFLGYLRFTETNSQDVAYIDSYGHDVYFYQGRRIWRYNLGSGGLTLENVTSQNDEANSRALARMDKKFWAAAGSEGVFVADDAYPKTTMYLYSPVWDFDLPDLQKVLLSIDVVSRPLPANTHYLVEYRLDEADGWTSAGTAVTTTGTVKKRFDISTSSSTVKFTTLQWRIGITSVDGVDTPRILSITPRAYVAEYEDAFDMTIKLDDDTSGNRQRHEQLTGRQKASRLWAYKTAKALVAFEDHYSSTLFADKDTYTVVLEDPFQEVVERGQSSLRLKLKVIG